MDPLPGTYALILEATVAREISVGHLGRLRLAPGWYVYVGSAFGPGGLRARCAHHMKVARKPHWHVDYLRAVTRLQAIWLTQDPQPREHQWAEQMARAQEARIPSPGFGSSDCRCVSHLSFHPVRPSFCGFRHRLFRAHPEHSVVMNSH